MGGTGGDNICLAAGEASGDLLAALVLPRLREQLPDAQFAGMAGDRMVAAGCSPWWHVRELSMRGYAEVLRHLPRILYLRHQLVQRVIRWPSRVYVGIDAPDFNLGVEQQVRAAGVTCVHYVSPSIWAWRPERIDLIRRAVDHMLLVFPFEEAIYRRAGLRATYVGHPLAATIPAQPDAAAARTRLGLAAQPTTVAILPGSRTGEVTLLGPVFCATLALLQRADQHLQAVLPAADDHLLRVLATQLEAAGVDLSRVRLTRGGSHDALEAADVVLVAAGTATLEAMLFQRPMVIAYRAPALTVWVTVRRALIPYFGLPNILCGRYTVPEFLQEAVTAPRLARALLRYLEQPAAVAQVQQQFAGVRQLLLRDTPALVAQAIADAAAGRRAPA